MDIFDFFCYTFDRLMGKEAQHLEDMEENLRHNAYKK